MVGEPLPPDSSGAAAGVPFRKSMLLKLAVLVAALLVLTAGLISWAGYVVARNIIQGQIHERLRVAASDRHAMVLAFADQQLERVGLVASRTKLRNLVAEFHENGIPEAEMQAGTRPILNDALNSTEGFRVISIADPDGRIITSTSDELLGTSVSDNPAFQVGLTRRHLGEPRRAGDTYVTNLASPALVQDKLIGVVLVEVDVTPLLKILTEIDGLGATGEVLVGRRDGSKVRYLFSPRGGDEQGSQLDRVPAMAAAIGGATASEITNFDGVEVLLHYRPITYQPAEYQEWGLVAKMDATEALAPLDEFRRTRIWIQLGVVVIGLLASFLVSRAITRPIRSLTQTAKAVAGGNLSAQVAVTTEDEIGVLGQTFNQMTRELQSTYGTLEERVRQRTAELTSEISRREEMQDELEQNAQRIQRIIDTANDAFISMNERGEIVEWNPQAQVMFGWSRDEVLTLSVADIIIPESYRDEHRNGVERFLKTREANVLNRRIELTALRRDGSDFPVEITITPQRLGNEFVFNAFLHDITQRKLDESALHEAREQAESANRSKSEFLANMSHEIRTPMNGIIGMGELLASTTLEPNQRDYLNMVRSSADSLLLLLNDILDFSKIEAGKLELQSIPFSLRDCIGATGHTLASRAAEKGIELACRVAPEVPDILIGDPGRLRQIVVNLVGNAIKFTERGEVVVDVAQESSSTTLLEISSKVSASDDAASADLDAAGPAKAEAPKSLTIVEPELQAAISNQFRAGRVVLRVSVKDTGVGIPPEKQSVIFEAFGQADASTTRQFGGTGLGLAISSQLVELMHGQIRVESEVGKGTTFSFTAEFGVSADQKLRAPTDLAVVRDMQVLIVDDNETNRRILQEILISWNMTPICASSAAEGLAAIRKSHNRGEKIPLVLLDCMMPGASGFDFARELRKEVSHEECTLIMVSSAMQAGDSELCRELHIARCMPKPVMHSELLNTILTEIRGEEDSHFVAESFSATETSEIPPRRILLAEDGVINRQVAIGFLKQRGHQVVTAGDGLEALKALKQEPFDLVLMDVQMPNMDGFACTAAIRRSEQGTSRHLPIIAMTANAMKGDRERCLEAGMDNYVAKPIDPDMLFEAVEAIEARVLSEHGDIETLTPSATAAVSPIAPPANESQASDSEPEPSPAEPTATATGSQAFPAENSASSGEQWIDWDVAMSKMPGGSDIAKDLAGMLLGEAPKLLEQIRTSQSERDIQVLRRAAHTLKGSLAIFGIQRAVSLAQNMEQLAKAEEFETAGAAIPELETAIGHVMDELQTYIDNH